MGEDGLARAGLFVSEYDQVSEDEKSDGDELHDLHAAVELHLDHVGELRERGGRKQRTAERGQDGQSGNAERVAKELSKAHARLAPSLFHQHAAEAHRRKRRHHDAAGHGEQQAEKRRLQHAERGKAQHTERQKDHAPARADVEEEVKEQHQQRRRADALHDSQRQRRRFQLHRRHRAARVAEGGKARIKVFEHLFIVGRIGDIGPFLLVGVPAHVVVRLQDHLEEDDLAITLGDGSKERVRDLFRALVAAVLVAVLDVGPLVEDAHAVIARFIEQILNARPGEVEALVVLLHHGDARAALVEILRQKLQALVILIADELVAVVHKVRRVEVLEHFDIGLGKFRAVHVLFRHRARDDLVAVALKQLHRVRPDAEAQVEQLFALHAVFLLLDEDEAVLALQIRLGLKVLKTGLESVQDPLIARGGLRPDDRVAHIGALTQPLRDLGGVLIFPAVALRRLFHGHRVHGDGRVVVQVEGARLAERDLVDAERLEEIDPLVL